MYCKTPHIFISLLLQFVQRVLAGKATAQTKILTVAEIFSELFFFYCIQTCLNLCLCSLGFPFFGVRN